MIHVYQMEGKIICIIISDGIDQFYFDHDKILKKLI